MRGGCPSFANGTLYRRDIRKLSKKTNASTPGLFAVEILQHTTRAGRGRLQFLPHIEARAFISAKIGNTPFWAKRTRDMVGILSILDNAHLLLKRVCESFKRASNLNEILLSPVSSLHDLSEHGLYIRVASLYARDTHAAERHYMST